MLLMVDLLSLRAREYAFLTRMFQEWEVRRARGSWSPTGTNHGLVLKEWGSLCGSVPPPLFLDLQLAAWPPFWARRGAL